MKNGTVLITGATGAIGSALTAALLSASAAHKLNLRVIAHGRNARKGEELSQVWGAEFVGGDIRKPLPVSLITQRLDYIFHCAAITKSADMASKPVDVITTAVDGTKNVLELAREMRSRSVVYLSSMEVYGQTVAREVTEADLGYIDLSNPRSCYPESKRLCECMCTGYFKQHKTPIKIARLAQTFGAGTPISDTRVFAQFARSAIAGEDIVLHTEGRSRGNYCYLADTVHALLVILLKGESGETYNVSNPDASMTIREMAELVAGSVGGGKSSVIVNIPPDIEARGYAPDVGFRLNADRLYGLGWRPKYGLAAMYLRMTGDWKEKAFYAESPTKADFGAIANDQ